MWTCTSMATARKVNRSWSGIGLRDVQLCSSLDSAAVDFSLGLNFSLQKFILQMIECYQTVFEFRK